ncbi:MAG: hypothetical protein JRI68_31645, partial [Deltaproteobacteria bacterium]|nr:hypothetical protein [Deltaproteobacteria bacterium]
MDRPKDTLPVARWLLVAALGVGTAAACSSGEGGTQIEPDLEPFVPGDCLPGELILDDGTCLPAGLPPPPPCEPGSVVAPAPGDCCAAGTVPLPDGSCQEAGVPPDGCGTGFVPDDEGGCVAVMPSATCGLGEMALPGETTCRVVAPCGGGTWGAIPVDTTTQHVDGAYVGGNSDGSSAAPWTTIGDGVTAAAPGAIVAVAAGTYAEGVVITGRPVRIWGRCPGLVSIEPPGDGVRIGLGADGSELHTLTIRGGGIGVDNAGAADVLVDRLLVANATDHAIRVRGDDHATNEASLTVTGSLIEAGHRSGILAAGSDLTVEDTVVHRGSEQSITGGEGIRVEAYAFGGNPQVPEATIRRVVVERTYRLGILFSGASGVIEDTLVRNILPTQGVGRGLAIEAHPEVFSRSDVVVRRSVVEGAHELGVLVSGSTAELENTVVRATQPSPITNESAGIHVQPQGAERSRLTLRHSSILETPGIGIGVYSADLELAGAIVRDVSYALNGMEGTGVLLGVSSRTLESSEATIAGSRIERHEGDGLRVWSAEADLVATVIGGEPQGPTQSAGVGILMDEDGALEVAPVLTVTGSLVRDNR